MQDDFNGREYLVRVFYVLFKQHGATPARTRIHTNACNSALVLRFNVSILATAFYPHLSCTLRSLTAVIEILRSSWYCATSTMLYLIQLIKYFLQYKYLHRRCTSLILGTYDFQSFTTRNRSLVSRINFYHFYKYTKIIKGSFYNTTCWDQKVYKFFCIIW